MIIFTCRQSPYEEPVDFFTTIEKAEQFCKAQKDYYDTYQEGKYATLGEYYIEEIEVK